MDILNTIYHQCQLHNSVPLFCILPPVYECPLTHTSHWHMAGILILGGFSIYLIFFSGIKFVVWSINIAFSHIPKKQKHRYVRFYHYYPFSSFFLHQIFKNNVFFGGGSRGAHLAVHRGYSRLSAQK